MIESERVKLSFIDKVRIQLTYGTAVYIKIHFSSFFDFALLELDYDFTASQDCFYKFFF